ncbi:hypothetical protein [Methylomonas rivi]|uniref:Uncharacterized protein n=1 Tax=Methylomonas rivi TaxID=2952226 RepID=A0ABT1U8L2_9GAMM|nr:hypothetical protein [Methylomonas sp. WSC-6]MCQ8129986.1 hypothetical protein [Methylomonas sp. WSC-6]
MNEQSNQTLLELMRQIQRDIGELKQQQVELSGQLLTVDERLLNVERCLINLRSDADRSRTRMVWSDDERTAFSNWLSSNTNVNDDFSNDSD